MNELIACVEDLVKETELDTPEMVSAIDKYEKILYINMTELKYNKKWYGARVFKYLFKLNGAENDPWKSEGMTINEEGKLTILQDFDISILDWSQFIYFLRSKHPPFFGAWMTTKSIKKNSHHEGYYNKIIQWLEDVNIVCNKLGGFPIFDKYYENFWEGNIVIEAFGSCIPQRQHASPQNPGEDIYDEYLWENFKRGSGRHLEWTSNLMQISQNWSVVSIDEKAATHDYIWYRRLK